MGSVKVNRRDLEEVMSLDDWLRTTDRVRNQKGLKDAWAITNTDCAFRINDEVGVQRSNKGNDWNNFGDGRSDLSERVYDDQGHDYGTYISLLPEKMIEEVIGQTPWRITVDRSKKYDNRAGAVDFTYRTSHAKSEESVREVTVTNSVSVTLEAGFEAYGASVKISSTYDYTKAEMDRQTTGKVEEEEVTVTVPAGKYFELHVVKKECTKRYRVRVPVVMEGWVGLATYDQKVWDKVFPLTDFVSKSQVTRWLNLQVNVASTEIEAISHAGPTDAAITKAKVLEEVAEEANPAPIITPTDADKKAHEELIAARLARRKRHD